MRAHETGLQNSLVRVLVRMHVYMRLHSYTKKEVHQDHMCLWNGRWNENPEIARVRQGNIINIFAPKVLATQVSNYLLSACMLLSIPVLATLPLLNHRSLTRFLS